MEIKEQDIDRLAALAQLELSPAERERFAGELSQILTYVSQLRQIDTTSVLPEGVVTPLTSRRHDVAGPTMGEAIMKNVPATEGGAVRSPRILP